MPSKVLVMACLLFFASAKAASAGQEFPPPSGSGPIVMMASGLSGPGRYTDVAKDLAALGYDVVLFDGNAMEGNAGAGMLSAIAEAQKAPHGIPGKMALVGFSLGGGMILYYGTQHAELALGAVVWYPATSFIRDTDGFARRLQMPVVMFAGGVDQFRNGCCVAAKGQVLADAARAAGKPFDLTIYPGADHDFVRGGNHYLPAAYNDALKKTAAALQQYFAR